MNDPYKGLLGIGAGNILASMIIAGFLLGWMLDTWLGTTPWAMLLCSALGFIGGFRRAHVLAGMREEEPQTGRDTEHRP
ncbi:MAG: AtpZ/AtpI family protein [Halothiobacillaceae bacterium]